MTSILALAVGLVALAEDPKMPSDVSFPIAVRAVTDGAHLVIRDTSRQTKEISLEGVVSPRPGDKGYSRSELELRSTIGRNGWIYIEGKHQGPTLVWAYGKLVNLEMIRKGCLRFDAKYGGKYADLFRQAEESAKRMKVGVWSVGG